MPAGAGTTAAAAVPDATLDTTGQTLKLLSAHHAHAAAGARTAKMQGSKASTRDRLLAVNTDVPAEKLAAAEVSRVLAAALAKSAMTDTRKAGNGKQGGASTNQLAEETDKEVREAAEAEAEKDAITAGDDDATAMSAPKVAPAGPNQPNNERLFDKTGLKKKPAKQPVKGAPLLPQSYTTRTCICAVPVVEVLNALRPARPPSCQRACWKQ